MLTLTSKIRNDCWTPGCCSRSQLLDGTTKVQRTATRKRSQLANTMCQEPHSSVFHLLLRSFGTNGQRACRNGPGARAATIPGASSDDRWNLSHRGLSHRHEQGLVSCRFLHLDEITSQCSRSARDGYRRACKVPNDPVRMEAKNRRSAVVFAEIPLRDTQRLDDWALANFPFDDHGLAIAVVPNSDQYSSPNYQVDEKNSGMSRHIASREWQLSNFKIFTHNVAYESNFGDPNTAAASYNYGAVTASFLLVRKPWRLFFKLMAGTYLAAGAALLGCYMKTTQPPVFSGRMGLQIGCLFAAIINHREVGNVTGRKDVLMLPDALQVLTYVLIFASLVLTLWSRSLTESGPETRAIRMERRITLFLALFFLFLNVALVWGALVVTPNPNMLHIIQVGD